MRPLLCSPPSWLAAGVRTILGKRFAYSAERRTHTQFCRVFISEVQLLPRPDPSRRPSNLRPRGGIDDDLGVNAPGSFEFEQDETHRPPKLRGTAVACRRSAMS
jgi:hypothetical protein